MPLFTTPDGHYTHAITTPGEGDGNDVVYDNWIVPGEMTPVWDKFGYEARLGQPPGRVAPPSPPPSAPIYPPPGAVPNAPPLTGGRLIRVSDGSDGELVNRGYSYWPSAWVQAGSVYCFAGHVDNHPRFFHVDLASGAVGRIGPLLDQFGYVGTGEGVYFDLEGWLYFCDGLRLRRVNPFTGEERHAFSIDRPSCRITQAHSSDDGSTHSATLQQIVESGAYPNIATVVAYHGDVQYFPARGTLDESAVSADGNYVIIKEDENNRVIHLGTRETRLILDSERALGHSDCGQNFMVGEADKPDPGMCGWWDLTKPLTLERFHPLFQTWNMGYVSVRGGRILHSSETHLRLIDRDTGAATTLIEHGGGSDYDNRVKASLSPCGRVAAYMANKTAYVYVL